MKIVIGKNGNTYDGDYNILKNFFLSTIQNNFFGCVFWKD